MNSLPRSIQKLIDEFRKLPGIGYKSASRMSYYFLRKPKESLTNISNLFLDIRDTIVDCKNCNSYTDNENGICSVCSDAKRNNFQLMVVEQPLDVITIDEAGFYNGQFYVLRGLISPIRGIGPDDLMIEGLVKRVENILKTEDNLEIIIALSTNLEGDATMTYLVDKLKQYPQVKISSLARGLPSGAELDYTDNGTMNRAFEGRNQIK